MKLLLIGGTVFLGRAIVEEALQQNIEVTLFNRGRSNPDLFPEVEKLVGNRDGGLEVLQGRTWDAVIDTCGYIPRLVRDSAKLLADAVDHYTFISTISVYSDFSQPHMDESAPLGTLEDPTVEQITGETYGPLKVLCEQAVDKAMNGRSLHVRAGLIVGPHDQSDRFSYWPHRVGQGGEALAPGQPDAPVQFIDVRDLARWTLQATQNKLTGAYNVTGPNDPITMQTVLDGCRETLEAEAQLTWVSDDFLQEQNVGAYVEMPLWVPATPEYAGFDRVNCQKAFDAGLVCRPLPETIQDTWNWLQTRSADHQWRAGLTSEREKTLLELWQESRLQS